MSTVRHSTLLGLKPGSVVFVQQRADRERWRAVVSENYASVQMLGVVPAAHPRVTMSVGNRKAVPYGSIVQVGETLDHIVIDRKEEDDG